MTSNEKGNNYFQADLNEFVDGNAGNMKGSERVAGVWGNYENCFFEP